MKRTAIVLGASLALLAPSRALADVDKATCVDAATRGQIARDEGKLRESKSLLVVCAQTACPAVVRVSCGEWLADVDARIPTVLLRATLDDRPTSDVRVTIDDDLLIASLPNQPIALDPGAHRFHYTHGNEQVSETITIKEREKARAITVRFVSPATPRTIAQPTPAPSPAPELAPIATSSRPVPLGVWVLGGVGVVALGAGALFGLTAKSQLDDLRATCAPRCSSSAKDTAYRSAVFADVALGVGAAALVGAGIWFLVRPEARESGIAPAIGPRSASLTITKPF